MYQLPDLLYVSSIEAGGLFKLDGNGADWVLCVSGFGATVILTYEDKIEKCLDGLNPGENDIEVVNWLFGLTFPQSLHKSSSEKKS